MSKAKVLVIDDDPEMLDLARFHLEKNGYEVTCAETGAQGLRLVAEHRPEVVLTDLKLPDVYGIDLVAKLKEACPSAEVIMITGYGAVTEAIEATKAGAFYFMEKPVEFEELMALIERAIERGRQAVEIERLRAKLREPTSYYNIIGSSRPMQNIYEIIESIAESDANVMILGESGTGKELIANAIHFKSARSKKPFVKINCSALPKELIESELFGHTKGAFTGATMEKMGLIGQAAGGSLLLDEIAEMPVELQPKLLRVLQERVYYRVGSEKALEADFRLISATNRSPLDAIRDGALREDLFYRINTIEIQVPPLRDRAEDVQHLAEHFRRIYSEKYNRAVRPISQLASLIVNQMPSPKSGGSRVDIFTQLEGAIVRAALERTRGNKQAEANLLGLYRPRLYSMLRKHNLHDTIRETEQSAPETDVAEDDLIESEAINQDPDPDLAEQVFAAPRGPDPEPPKESTPSKEPSGEDIVGPPNISGPDAAEFHFRKGVPYQY